MTYKQLKYRLENLFTLNRYYLSHGNIEQVERIQLLIAQTCQKILAL